MTPSTLARSEEFMSGRVEEVEEVEEQGVEMKDGSRKKGGRGTG